MVSQVAANQQYYIKLHVLNQSAGYLYYIQGVPGGM